jgi:steroid delta-isomerase-like uncharacterized protein
MEPAKAIIERFVEELWNARRLDVADQIFSEDCVTHQLRSGVLAESAHRGPQEIKEHVSGWLMSFPDLRFHIEQMITERDRVVSHLVMEGTHQGTWMGIAPTGKRLQICMITIHRIANGKIAEDWVLVESLGLFQQLGAVPDTAELIRNFAGNADSKLTRSCSADNAVLSSISIAGKTTDRSQHRLICAKLAVFRCSLGVVLCPDLPDANSF